MALHRGWFLGDEEDEESEEETAQDRRREKPRLLVVIECADHAAQIELLDIVNEAGLEAWPEEEE